MEDDYKTSRRNKERDKGIRRGADDDYYYRDTEDTLVYRERKNKREYYHDEEEDFSEEEKSPRSPEKSSRHRERREHREKKESSRKEKRESPDKRRKNTRESRDPHSSSRKERSVHYKEEKRHSKHSRDDRGRSKERARRKSRKDKRINDDLDADQNEENEEPSEDEKKKSTKYSRKSSKKISDVSDNELSDGSPLHEIKQENHLKEKLPSETHPPQDSLEKVRRERSKETTRRKKSRDTSRKREESKEDRTKRRTKSKSRRKNKRHTQEADLSLAISETYEEMKKSSQSSWEVKEAKRKEKKKSDEIHDDSKIESKDKSRERRRRAKLKSEKSDHKERKESHSKKKESKIRKELRKKQEPRQCHSDSEIDMGKSRKNTRNLSDDAQETSSNASEDKQLDIDSLYDLYKDPDPNSKPPTKEVVIREPNNKDTTEPPKKISIDQTDIRSKLIRVLFQRVKELLKETELLRNERKTLCQTIEALSDDLEKLRKKEFEKAAKEAKIEERLVVLADEMKITPTGNSFREEIHHILHDIQAKYQTHWKEHESKIQEVQNDAESNIQNLMKNIVGKYLEFSELNDPTKTAQDMAKFTAELREKLKFNEDKMTMNDKDKFISMIKKQPLEKNNSEKKLNGIDKRVSREKEMAEFRQAQQKQNMALQNRKEEVLIETLHRERQRMLQQAETSKDLQSSFERKENSNLLNKVDSTRLNEPLFINTHAYENNDEIYNGTKPVKDNRDLLLQIAKPTVTKNTDDFYHFNQRPAQYHIPDGKDPSPTGAHMHNVQQNKERLIPDRSTHESVARSQQIYEETKNAYRQSNHHQIEEPTQAPTLGKYKPALSDIPSSRYSQQYNDEEYRQLTNMKMDTKEFWRHKLLQPSSNEMNFSDREALPPHQTSVRNTY